MNGYAANRSIFDWHRETGCEAELVVTTGPDLLATNVRHGPRASEAQIQLDWRATAIHVIEWLMRVHEYEAPSERLSHERSHRPKE